MKSRLTTLIKATLFSCVALSAMGMQLLQAQDTVTLDQRLPASVYLYASNPNATKSTELFKKSSSYELYTDPEFAEFTDQIKEQINGFLEGSINLTCEEIFSIFHGEVSFALFKPTDNPLAVVIAIDFGESRETVDALLEKAEQAAEGAPEAPERSEEEYEGSTIIVFDPPTAPPAPIPVEAHLTYCIKDTTILISNSVAAVKEIIDRWEGGTGSFAESPNYTTILDECQTERGKASGVFYLDLVGLFNAGADLAGPQNFQAAMAKSMLPVLGLANLKAIGACSELFVDDFETVTTTLFVVDPEATGLLSVLSFPEVALEPADWVPADVVSFQAGNWDNQGAYEAIAQLVDNFQGPGALNQIIDGLAQNPQGPQVHIKNDIIDRLSGKFQTFTKGGEGEGFEALQTRALFGAEVVNAEAMEDVLARLAESPGFPGEIREFRGETIYEISNPAAQANPAFPAQVFGFAVAKDYLFMATHIELLEEVLRGSSDAEKLSDSDTYQQISSHFPEATSMISYTDPTGQLKPVYEQFRSGPIGMLLADKIDLSTLPEFDVIEKYISTVGSYAVPTENGAKMVQFQLKP